ncbi:MAG: hypothetical protein HYY79_11530, partial [Betaproteobacteria bacterium]|nr:hypothetical protein [Betaproteobacteria bacterium]
EATIVTERRAREEAEAQAEAQRKAHEEALRHAQEEAEKKARAEVEAMIDTERKAREEAEAKAEAERRAREAAEKRAQAEIAAKIEAERRAREEAERQAEAARRAAEEAQRRAQESARDNSEAAQKARAEAEAKLEAARKAHEAAIAKVEAEARARAEAEKKAEEERQARAAAEERAKQAVVARVVQEQELRAKAEEEVKARVVAELKARQQAEYEAEVRLRTEAQARAEAAAKKRAGAEDEARAAARAYRRKAPANWPKIAVIAVVVVIALALAALHVVPLSGYIAGAQQALSQRLNQPVGIATMRVALFPAPQLKLEDVTIGKLQEIRIGSIVVSGNPLALLGDVQRIDEVQLTSVSIGEQALAWIPAWTKAPPAPPALQVRRIRAAGVKMPVPGMEMPSFSADVTLEPGGALQRALFSSEGKLRVDLAQKDRSLRLAIEAKAWALPAGPALEFDELSMVALLDKNQVVANTIEGSLAGAAVKGSARLTWSGGLKLEGDLTLKGGNLAQLMSVFTREFSASGTLNASANFALQGENLESLFSRPRIEATFTVEKGVLNNVDIVRAIQSPSRVGQRGGKTSFNDLTGTLQVADGRYSYKELRLTSGPMNATGYVEVSPGSELSGRINAELGSKSVTVARGILTVAGRVKDPVLRP